MSYQFNHSLLVDPIIILRPVIFPLFSMCGYTFIIIIIIIRRWCMKSMTLPTFSDPNYPLSLTAWVKLSFAQGLLISLLATEKLSFELMNGIDGMRRILLLANSSQTLLNAFHLCKSLCQYHIFFLQICPFRISGINGNYKIDNT